MSEQDIVKTENMQIHKLKRNLKTLREYIEPYRKEIVMGKEFHTEAYKSLINIADEYNGILKIAKKYYPDDEYIMRLKRIYSPNLSLKGLDRIRRGSREEIEEELSDDYYKDKGSHYFLLLKGIDFLNNHFEIEDMAESISKLKKELEEKDKKLKRFDSIR